MTIYAEAYDEVNADLDRLGSVLNTDDELEAALLKIGGDAENSTEAKMALEALGYLPYTRQIIYNTSGKHGRATRPAESRTNGYLERRANVGRSR